LTKRNFQCQEIFGKAAKIALFRFSRFWPLGALQFAMRLLKGKVVIIIRILLDTEYEKDDMEEGIHTYRTKDIMYKNSTNSSYSGYHYYCCYYW
jgi:hypothetical protein